MADYRLQITEENWHAFDGQLDGLTHEELKVGDTVVQCATCKYIFQAKYLEGSECPFGHHDFVGKRINVGPIRITPRGQTETGQTGSGAGTQTEPRIRIVGRRTTQTIERQRTGRTDVRTGIRTGIRTGVRRGQRLQVFIRGLTWASGIGLVIAAAALLIVVLAGGRLDFLRFRGIMWSRQLTALWRRFPEPLYQGGVYLWGYASRRLPRLYEQLLQWWKYGWEQLLEDPRAFFQAVFQR